MTGDGEVEIIDSADRCAEPQNHNVPNETGALVEVTFQKRPSREQKYLEAEPKALGVTQIVLSLFAVSIVVVLMHSKRMNKVAHIITCNLSLLGVIAGSVAIAAQNLHLPKVKACLAMQVVTCASAAFCFVMGLAMGVEGRVFHQCWDYDHENVTSQAYLCYRLVDGYTYLVGVEMLVQATQVAISGTLAAFCCKVVQCCSPQTSVPMIVVNAPAAP